MMLFQATVSQKDKEKKSLQDKLATSEQQLYQATTLKASAERERNTAKHNEAQTKVCRMQCLYSVCLSVTAGNEYIVKCM